MTASQEELNALQQAIKLEKDGRAYYLEAEEKATHPLVRETFKWLASWELQHIEYIQKFYDALSEATDDTGLDDLLAKGSGYNQMAKTIFEVARAEIDKTFQADTEVAKVYEVAKEFEDRAATFYTEQLEKSVDPRARKLFRFLVDQERDHFRLLDNSYRYVFDPELWYTEEEGWMFDGG